MLLVAVSSPSGDVREIRDCHQIFILFNTLTISEGAFWILSQKSYHICHHVIQTAIRRSWFAATYSAWALMRSKSLPTRHCQRPLRFPVIEASKVDEQSFLLGAVDSSQRWWSESKASSSWIFICISWNCSSCNKRKLIILLKTLPDVWTLSYVGMSKANSEFHNVKSLLLIQFVIISLRGPPQVSPVV
ncbi:hypothetical protein PHYBLDRAFT_167952 [Phycomyces blakesleeanus NRRL 1555(-)]|uniref:Uncharacterized protein n=1 Tax=Phycomyces blakesleeanus (strain ATCC 8743b / DSM 1359 / FGSC 10004 / NBRC 33097 / NRRL 1555) TaxID=763407 RepID=A0A162XFF4_PHYB8|nr:hypothetical protein PHYBLDRAFT_167952 [Phycomyces blakesleeanus NRRL 1555(-)]OAD74545.1 hypothetical protein PHYBLDRAFT_167952 [Phycomyces blakesleeanus NRRL 1555(-)]|eukprot:XP_018292585.1 hypothetical protein PHYBLDRAFT_167952 [Phycomyces blakesleeanus NRRL 1555(-)]